MDTSSKKQRKQSKDASEQYETVSDKRFADALSAPVFKPLSSSKHQQGEVDERFAGMQSDERFSVLPGSGMDARGKKASKPSAKASNSKESADPKSSSTKNMKAAEMEQRLDYLTKLARGEVSGSENESENDDVDDQSEDEEEDDKESDDEETSGALIVQGKSPLDIPGGEESEEEVELGEATNRISILNCDWDNIRAEDLMVILQSFCPPGHQVLSVVVYPSDYGKERMAEEARHGPRGIWISDQFAFNDEEDGNNGEEMDVDEEDDDNNDDSNDDDDMEEAEDANSNDIDDADNNEEDEQSLYEHPDDNSYSASASDNDSNDSDSQSAADAIEGDFSRPKGSVGLVMHDDLPPRKKLGKKEEGESDFNEVALRQYELSKLRYYFAIATCDSIDTANTLYTELDGIEFENSAMALELRFVPDELDLSSREIRDVSHTLPTSSYKPPEFVINALQHTDVKCTWDEGEKTRSDKLTNFSAWRNLKESDFAQYIASSSEDEAEVNDDVAEQETEQEKKKRMRKLLLGDLASDSDADSEDNQKTSKKSNNKSNNKLAKDDFFNEDKTLEALGEEDELVIEYIPEAEKASILQRKHDKHTTLTPLEMEQQKQSEKKKLKKEKRLAEVEERMLLQQEQESLAQQQASAALKKKNKRGKKQLPDAAAEEIEEVEELQESFRGRKQQQSQDLQQAKKKINKKTPFTAIADDLTTRQKGGVKSSTTVSTDFKLDVHDDRFKQVFEGDANFGIDRTAAEFRETTGMKKILKEQRKKRKLEESASVGDVGGGMEQGHCQGSNEMESLAKKLKQKYQQ